MTLLGFAISFRLRAPSRLLIVLYWGWGLGWGVAIGVAQVWFNYMCAATFMLRDDLGPTFQIGGSSIDFPAELASRFAKLDALRLLP